MNSIARNVIIADNQAISNAGWYYLFSRYFERCVLTSVDHKKDLLERLTITPDSMVVLDYLLFDFESANELLILQARFPKVDWIVFSEELSADFLRALLFNSHSFSLLMKDSSQEEIVSCLRQSIASSRYICNHVSNILLDNSRNTQTATRQVLTPTEQEILKDMALGKTTKEIATNRFVSAHTIMTHRKNIFRKIEVNNVHEATKYAIRAGIVDVAEYYI